MPSRRQFDALVKLFDSPFRNCFVGPRPDLLQTEPMIDPKFDDCSSFQLNESQKRAISVAGRMCVSDSVGAASAHQITMIQGMAVYVEQLF